MLEFGYHSDQVVHNGFTAKIKFNNRRKRWEVAKIDGRPEVNEMWTPQLNKKYDDFLQKVKQALDLK